MRLYFITLTFCNLSGMAIVTIMKDFYAKEEMFYKTFLHL